MHCSPTAENIFSDRFETKSGDLSQSQGVVLSKADPERTDIVFVMEDWMRPEIGKRFPSQDLKKRSLSLNVPNLFSYMGRRLVKPLADRNRRSLGFCLYK